MTRAVDITGKRFGRLVAISFEPAKNGSYGLWLFRCDCGKEKRLRTGNVLGGRTVSCGCVHKEKHRRYGEATMNSCYANHRGRGKVKGIGFLPKDVWEAVVKMPCTYCGGIDTKNITARRKSARYKIPEKDLHLWEIQINGVDRVDSSLGYTAENCVPCCKVCNIMKNSMSESAFVEHVRRIGENFRIKTTG